MPACFGVACNAHGSCARYHAINGAHNFDARIVTCHDGKEYPLFIFLEV